MDLAYPRSRRVLYGFTANQVQTKGTFFRYSPLFEALTVILFRGYLNTIQSLRMIDF